MKIGILPLGRSTFDVELAEEKLAASLDCLSATEHQFVGPRSLLFDEAATLAAIDELADERIDRLLILQITFTDASMTVAAAERLDVPLTIWAMTEPRSGGRLRLNAFCGLNLASHALGLKHREFSWAYGNPDKDLTARLEEAFVGERLKRRLNGSDAVQFSNPAGQRVADAIHGKRVARIGEHPVGFDTCAYDSEALKSLAGVTVDEHDLTTLFEAAGHVETEKVDALRTSVSKDVRALDDVDQQELDRSLRLKAGLDSLRADGPYDAFAIRCWPETFTEYGGAVCGPAAMSGEARVPCACEADVYGALTQLILQEVADSPVFLTDLVDMDVADNTGVVWHCGQAPISMCDPDVEATATIHTNRKMPLLYQFPLKPGPVTFLRISQAFGEQKMVIASGEVLKRAISFTGTSGVVRFEKCAGDVLENLMDSGLEHHMALTYGDHRAALRSVAAAMKLPLLEL